jgi:hypothetical protein
MLTWVCVLWKGCRPYNARCVLTLARVSSSTLIDDMQMLHLQGRFTAPSLAVTASSLAISFASRARTRRLDWRGNRHGGSMAASAMAD